MSKYFSIAQQAVGWADGLKTRLATGKTWLRLASLQPTRETRSRRRTQQPCMTRCWYSPTALVSWRSAASESRVWSSDGTNSENRQNPWWIRLYITHSEIYEPARHRWISWQIMEFSRQRSPSCHRQHTLTFVAYWTPYIGAIKGVQKFVLIGHKTCGSLKLSEYVVYCVTDCETDYWTAVYCIFHIVGSMGVIGAWPHKNLAIFT